MMKWVFKLRRYLIIAAVIILVGAGIWIWRTSLKPQNEDKIEVAPARMVDLRPVADLCGMEIYREATVVDTINNKVIFGIWKVNGRVLFDLDDLQDVVRSASDGAQAGDTLRLKLPKERVELLESNAPGSWRVVDTYSLKFMGNDRMTPEEENRVKREAIAKLRRDLYSDGTVATARKEAAATLERLLTPMLGCPVIVSY